MRSGSHGTTSGRPHHVGRGTTSDGALSCPSGPVLRRALGFPRLEQGDILSPSFADTAAFRASRRSSEEVPLGVHASEAPSLHAPNKRDEQSASGFARVVMDQQRMVPRVQQDLKCSPERLLPRRREQVLQADQPLCSQRQNGRRDSDSPAADSLSRSTDRTSTAASPRC